MAEWNSTLLILDDEKDIVEAYVGFLSPKANAPARKSSRSAAAPASVGPAASVSQAPPYRILTAHTGEDALEIVKRELKAGTPIAGGFFDVKLEGGMDGIATLQEIWKLDPELHATIVTAYQDRNVDDMDQLFGERFKDQWDYLNKPFTQAEIIQKARQMCAAWNRRKQLILSERLAAIGQVSKSVGHEFGNLLQAILGKAELGMMDKDLEKTKERFEAIFQAANRAGLVVKNLQSITRQTPGKSPVMLRQVIQNTLTLVNHELMKGGIQIQDLTKACASISANAPELEQVFLNLIINARHAMPQGGNLEIGCKDEGEGVVGWVRDAGTGIAPDVLPRIFDYAFTTKGEKGSGLGLSISKEIVEKHGGRISVESEVGKGTCFTLFLPKQTA